MTDITESVRLLQSALSGLHNTGVGVVQTQTGAWLNEFRKTREMWQACLTLYDADENKEVSFLCANLLLRKARSEWSGLSPEEKRDLQLKFRLVFLNSAWYIVRAW